MINDVTQALPPLFPVFILTCLEKLKGEIAMRLKDIVGSGTSERLEG